MESTDVKGVFEQKLNNGYVVTYNTSLRHLRISHYNKPSFGKTFPKDTKMSEISKIINLYKEK